MDIMAHCSGVYCDGWMRTPPKRAASALTAGDEEHGQPRHARAQDHPRREEEHEVVKPHVRDGGPVERDDEEEEPQREPHWSDKQVVAVGPFFTDAAHGEVSLSDVFSSGIELSSRRMQVQARDRTECLTSL